MRRLLSLLLFVTTLALPFSGAATGAVSDWTQLCAALESGLSTIEIDNAIFLEQALVLGDVHIKGTNPLCGLMDAPITVQGKVTIEAVGITLLSSGDELAAITVRDGGELILIGSQVNSFAFEGKAGILVEAGGKTTLQDSHVEGDGGAIGGDALAVYGEAHIQGGTLTGGYGYGGDDANGRALLVEGVCTAQGSGLSSESGPAVRCVGGRLTLTDCTLDGTPALEAIEGAKVTVDGVDLFSEDAPIVVDDDSEVDLEGEDNEAQKPEDKPIAEGEVENLAKDIALPARIQLLTGQCEVPQVAPVPAGAKILALHWNSLDPSIALVDSVGNILGISAGETVVTASLGSGHLREIAVEVLAPLDPAPESADSFAQAIPQDVFIVLAPQDDAETVSVFLAGEGGATAYREPDSGSAALITYPPGALIPAVGGSKGAYRAVRVAQETGYIHLRELTERAWPQHSAGSAAATLCEASSVCQQSAQVLPPNTPVQSLITVGDVTAALWQGQVAYFPAHSLHLLDIQRTYAEVSAPQWIALLAQPDEYAQRHCMLAPGARLEIGAEENGYVLAKIGDLAGYIRADQIEPIQETRIIWDEAPRSQDRP